MALKWLKAGCEIIDAPEDECNRKQADEWRVT